MATTTTDFDIVELADMAVGALAPVLDDISAFTTGIEMDANEGDSAKVFVHTKNNDSARDWDEDSDNYLDDNGSYSITGVNVPLDNHIFDNAIFSQNELNRVDMNRVAQGLANNVARKFLIRLYDQMLLDANFGSVTPAVGAPTGFTNDDLADLEVFADDLGMLQGYRSCVLYNTYFANMKKDGVLIANKNSSVAPGIVQSRYEEINGFNIVSSSVLKSATAPAGENTVGFITDGTGIGLAIGEVAFTGEGTGVAESVTAIDPNTGIPLSIRKVYDQGSGKWSINAELLMGFKVLDAGALKLLKSQ